MAAAAWLGVEALISGAELWALDSDADVPGCIGILSSASSILLIKLDSRLVFTYCLRSGGSRECSRPRVQNNCWSRLLCKDFREMNIARDSRLIQKTVWILWPSHLFTWHFCAGHTLHNRDILGKNGTVPFAQGTGLSP